MALVDCSCLGNNPDCERCFGRGYFDPDQTNNLTPICKKNEKAETDDSISFEESIKKLSKKAIITLVSKLEKKIIFNYKQLKIIKNPKIRSQYEKGNINMEKKLEIIRDYIKSLESK